MANFSQMYEQYVEQVYCFLRGLSGDESFAEELTRKTFYQAFLHVDSFENRSSVFEWLCEIGKNVYLREMKRRKKTGPGNQLKTSLRNQDTSRKQSERNFPEKQHLESKSQIPAFEGEVSGGEVDIAERKKRIRRGLRRIRCRWICSVMAVTLILLMLMGVMLIVGGSLKGGVFGK